MIRPDIIVLVLNFKQADKSKTQVSSKKFILGEPDKGKQGFLEERVEEIVGRRTISCYKFSLIKYPITLPSGRAENRARGAVGMFRFIGSVEDLDQTLQAIKDYCNEVIKKGKSRSENWESFEVYSSVRWFP